MTYQTEPTLLIGPPVDASYEIQLLKRSRLSNDAHAMKSISSAAWKNRKEPRNLDNATSEELVAVLLSKPDLLFASTHITFKFSDFFRFRPSTFLDAAYLSILRRPITGIERNKYEHRDFGGKANRIWVVKQLCESAEGRQLGIKIRGRWLWQSAYKVYEVLYRDRVHQGTGNK